MESKDKSTSFNSASKVEGLSKRQEEEIKAQSRPNAALIHETIRAEGESELERRWWAILLSGFAAGLSIGLSFFVQAKFHAFIADEAIRKLVAPLGDMTGFLVVVLGRQQLFTENALAPILPLLHHRDRKTFLGALRLWTLVLTANVAGTWAAGFVFARQNIFERRVWDAFVEIGGRTVQGSFGARQNSASSKIARDVSRIPAGTADRTGGTKRPTSKRLEIFDQRPALVRRQRAADHAVALLVAELVAVV